MEVRVHPRRPKYPPMVCPGCDHTWEPRVQYPQRCPNHLCQANLIYPDKTAAQGEGQ